MESSLISTEGVLGASFIIMSANMMENDVNGGGDDGDGDDGGGGSGGNGDDGEDGMLMLMMMTLPVSQTFVNNLSVSYLILDSASVFYEISMKYCDNIGEGVGEIGRKCKELFREENTGV